jgi:uncharacterized membrane protein
MSKFITGLFDNSEHAGQAISELKEKDLADQLSVIAKDEDTQELNTENVEGDFMHGAKGGAIAGAAVGGLGALAIGATTVTLPGLGLIAAGPLATILAGITGGAMTGGVVGALVDQGVTEDQAKSYESDIKSGQVLATIKADDEYASEIHKVLKAHGAKKVESFDS